MRLDDYIDMTDTSQTDFTSSAASLLGTVYTETEFLNAFAPATNQSAQEQKLQLQDSMASYAQLSCTFG